MFAHEAAAIDEANQHAYQTEDVGDGRFYRFVYDAPGDLSAGELQVAEVMGDGPEGPVTWHAVPDPSGAETDTAVLSIIYDAATSSNPILTGVDNLTVSPTGDIVVAEDGGDMQIVALIPDDTLVPLVQVVGHDLSEITGPAFDPSLQRLYFSSQRGDNGIDPLGMSGVTYEATGPFFI